MSAFIDARCQKCNKKIGWFGEMKDRPPCPKCGHRPSTESLEAAETALMALEEKMTKEMLDEE